MRLSEIKKVDTVVDLSEGVIPFHITMTLEQVVNAGKITNSVQSFVMAGLVGMFRGGGPFRWVRDLNAYGMSTMGTDSEMIEAVRGLAPTEQVGMAEWLLVELQQAASYESTPQWVQLAQQMDAASWMRFVLQKQK